jgi:Ca2+-binding EF-hand superfamily protein
MSARDRDGTGYITTDDLAAVLRTIGVTLAPFEVEAVLHDVGVLVDGFGKLDYRRFLDAMKPYLLPGGCLL